MKTAKQLLFIVSSCLLLYSCMQISSMKLQEINNQESMKQFVQEQETSINEFIYEIDNSIGWLTMAQTKSIDMPIMQASDNDFYLSHDAFGNENILGAAFLQAEIKPESSHLIIHGHSTFSDVMFTELKYYLNQDYVEANPSFLYYEPDKTYLCEIISVYSFQPADLSHYAVNMNEQEYQEYLIMILASSTVSLNPEVSLDTRLMTLSTCDMRDTSYRILVHAKMTEI